MTDQQTELLQQILKELMWLKAQMKLLSKEP